MNPFDRFRCDDHAPTWVVSGLDPLPEEEWKRILGFLGLSREERAAMLSTVEVLLRRGHELVVTTYDALLQNPDTAAILGWEQTVDPDHLAERRRFFTVWLTRVIGLDLSDELARYLFRAGKLHAGHGPRRIHVPPVYVTGSTSLVFAAFARFLGEEMGGDPAIPQALSGWNKLVTAHLHLMQMGYQSATALDHGDYSIQIAFFGRLRDIVGTQAVGVGVDKGAHVHHALRKLFNYYPNARAEALHVQWQGSVQMDHTNTPWFVAEKSYTFKPMWRVLCAGKDLDYLAGAETPIHMNETIQIFPPGR